jgi:3-methyladenine DNA glycosylase AlkC
LTKDLKRRKKNIEFMAEPLKNMFNPAFFEKLCPVLTQSIPGFDCRDFIYRVFNNTWPDRELKERVRHIAVVLHHFLPKDFRLASAMLAKLAGALIKNEIREQGFETIFIPEYILVFGCDYPDESLSALEEITKLVSAEYAVRPFIMRYPEKTMAKMLAWSQHADANVRRLSSEGCRPRLPWAMGIPFLKKDPQPILPILENLKVDPSAYVRRSVANNLNDIAKDHPDLVLSIVKKWQGKNPNTEWIIRHGCRTLLKRGDENALTLHGFNPGSRSRLISFTLPKKKVRIGDKLNFAFDFINQEKSPANFRLEYAIDYITSSGKTSRKIFKISENNFIPGQPVSIQRKQSFKNFTTRKHFKGKHFITILANGKKLAGKEFIVC